MKVTLEMIDELRSRVNVTYEEAKEALEENEGDIVKAIISLEKRKKGNNDYRKSNREKAEKKVNRTLNKFLSTDFVLKKKEKVYVNIPLWIVLIAGLFTFPFSVITLVILIALGFQMRIVTGKKTKFDINKNMDKVTKKIKETTDKIFEESEENIEAVENEENNDDENEVTIE
jgi:hypothetical protein